jgi:glycosyltransferase involved in cell wall biosynthesis
MTYSGTHYNFSPNNAIIRDKENPVVMAIIPAYNESHNIQKITTETSKYVTMIIVVDDGSHDNTAELATSKNVKVLRNRRNMGKGTALKKGLIECLQYNPDIIVTLDADGQHDPAEIPKLLKPIEDGEADIVIGSRYAKNSLNEVSVSRGIGLSVINFINRSLIKSTINDSQSGFRAYSKNVLSIILGYNSTGYGVETEQLAIAELYGFQIVEVPVTIRYRGLKNTSKKNSVLHGANIVLTIFRILVERRPLLCFGIVGIILIGAAVITTSQMLFLFNQAGYFSIPLALLTLGFVLLGTLVLLTSFVFHTLKKFEKDSYVTTSYLALISQRSTNMITRG